MFVYLSKKIAIPNGVKLKSLRWNATKGWIVCGGDNGLLKVLKLDSGRAADKKGAAAPSNLSMNQTLEGHNGAVVCVCWNEIHRKLTTSDQYGLIIVWMLHKGMWFEEMINNRNKSTVRGMKWTSDGERICIIYEDGAVIVGSVDGNRKWGKELKTELCHVEWSPDGRNIIFGTLQCEVHIYDSTGNFISKLPLHCLEEASAPTSLIGIHWYDGSEGFQDINQPTLAIGFQNGRLQLMRHEADENPVLIDTGLVATNLQWNTDGSVLALAGNFGAGGAGRDISMVQFYSPLGQLLRTLKVPGSGIHALSWEGGSLRVALAVDSFIYFANIRPDYRWGYFGETLVIAYTQPERSDTTVLFWNTRTDERSVKFFKQLLAIRAASETCVLGTPADDGSAQFVLILCNVIGSPLDAKYIDFEPQHLLITPYHVVAANHTFVYVWQYRTLMSKLTSVDLGTGSLRRKEGRERAFHIDDDPALNASLEPAVIVQGRDPTPDQIIAMGASQSVLLVARESGVMHRYSLPHLSLDQQYTLRFRPQSIAINCDSTRAAIIDTNGVLSFFDLSPGATEGGEVMQPAAEGEAPTRFERKDAWDMRWADDNPELFALMEKTRMFIFRGLEAEEPVLSSAYICSFSQLEIQAVLLDQLMREPESPSKEYLLKFETRALREGRELLEKASLSDATKYIEENPNPKLWRLLAEAALQKLDFVTADQAFVHNSDYMGVQFVKRLRLLDDAKKQAAEVAAYFGNFDEAERIYRDLDRRDLSLQLRANIGDWGKVVQLVNQGGGDDSMLQTAWNRLGDYLYEQQRPARAAQYYIQAKNMEALMNCYCATEDWTGLARMTTVINEGSPLLIEIGHRFAAVGMSEEAVAAFTKGGNIKVAVESCVASHHWETAVKLAESYEFPEVQSILAKYAKELLDAGKQLHAVELYRKANQYTDAAKLLASMGAEIGETRMNPLRAKKLFVMAALEVERMRKSMITTAAFEGTQTAAQTLDSLVEEDKATGGDKWLDSSWRGAEAYHFLLLAQHQLYNGYPADAMRTALRLRSYENVLPADQIYAIIALSAFYAKFFGQCSKAFIKLKSLSLPEHKKAAIAKLALAIFSQYSPADPATKSNSCPNRCRAPIKEWEGRCAECGTQFATCVASGRSILDPDQTSSCRVCKHRFYNSELRSKRNCPLCHSPLQLGMHHGSSAELNLDLRREHSIN